MTPPGLASCCYRVDDNVAAGRWTVVYTRVYTTIHDRGDRLDSARAVGELPGDVDVTVVPGGLFDQVEEDPAERDRLGPPAKLAPGRGVQVQCGHQLAVPIAGGPVLRQQL